MFRYGRRRRLSPEEKAANAAAREARNNAAMTCQVCARKILANTGVIAHHGYQRPYEGWQTSSCMGARHLPFETDRAILGRYIETITGLRNRLEESKRKVIAEECEVSFSYTDYSKRRFGGKPEKVTVRVTRNTFEAVRAEHKNGFDRSSVYSFDTLKKWSVDELTTRINFLNSDIRESQARFDGWKKTHEWKEPNWEKTND